MSRGNTFARIEEGQPSSPFAAAARLLGVHVTTAFKWAQDGKLKTVETPVGRRIHLDEIRRQAGETAA